MEKISLYAYDMLLYLEDAGPSLQLALEVIQKFGRYSSLKINWDKSQIVPIDVSVPPELQTSSPLLRVSSMTYL